uniref:Putative reverse transcriptase-RNase H-integrase n=1 Tax=Moniliophthora roreri TaxID=221103 RepID=A0A0W0FPY8_MONRR
MPGDVRCTIKLKSADASIARRSYPSPRKYMESWRTLVKSHLDAGCICPSSSPYASPAFLVPKSDPSALPRWVNDYRELNSKIETDKYPLPCIEDILADAGKGKIWSKLDMTDAFFHTKMSDDSIPLTAITTPLGLFEWTVMPQSLKNSPSVHQRRVNNALREYIGVFCHIYLDDIIIWSDSFEEHERHLCLILEALRGHRLYCNKKKSDFFIFELHFLEHVISTRGIEPDESKVARIKSWPTPQSPGDIWAFLGLTCYLASFLRNLAEHTRILSPLTSLQDHEWPGWSQIYSDAFTSIKNLVTSAECLTVIDHDNPGDNKIWLTTDASDWRTGAVLS